MNCLKKKLLLSMTLGVGVTGGLGAMETNKPTESEKGILYSLSGMFFSKSGMVATGLGGIGLGWWTSTDDQKKEVKKMGSDALDYAAEHKVPFVAGGLALGVAGYLGHKYFAVSSEKTTEKLTQTNTTQTTTTATQNGLLSDVKLSVPLLQHNGLLLSDSADVDGGTIAPVDSATLLPAYYVNFTDLVLKPLYSGEEQASAEEIKELCELFRVKPYTLFFNDGFLDRLTNKGSEEVQTAFIKAMKERYNGNLFNLFLSESTAEDIQTRFIDENQRHTIMPLFYFLAGAIEGSGPLGDQAFMKELRSKNLLSRATLFSFLNVLFTIYNEGYKQDFFGMMQDAQRDDLVVKYAGNLDSMQALLNDSEVMKLEGCAEWLTDVNAHLGAFAQTMQNFLEDDINPYLPNQQ